MKWISVDKRLPKKYKKVLCLYEDFSMDVAIFFDIDNFSHQLHGKCTYWAKLPQPPKNI